MMGMTVLSIVGNPKPASKTAQVADTVAARIASALDADTATLELGPIAADLTGWGAPAVDAAKEALFGANVLVFASPVYKATYTGLMKLMLDQIGAGELSRHVAVPVMVGGGPTHTLAVEESFRPVLIELGASCPSAGLYVIDSTLDTLDAQVEAWADTNLLAVTAVANAFKAVR
jgi:FMN reductase